LQCRPAGRLLLEASLSIADRTLFAIAAIILAVYHALAGSVPEPLGQFNDYASIGLIRDFDERNDEPQTFNGARIDLVDLQHLSALEFLEQAPVIDVEAERLGGCIETGAVDEERDCAMHSADVLRHEADVAIQLSKPAALDVKLVRLGRMHVMAFASQK
jgi:hypothetical protein